MNYNQLNGHNRIDFMAKGSLGKYRFIFYFSVSSYIFIKYWWIVTIVVHFQNKYLSIIITKFGEILLSG